MAKLAKPLTARRVATEQHVGMHADGGGLYLRIAPGGSKGWIFRYQISGTRREMGLGSVSTFTLAEARDRARVARQLVADGVDPVDDRRAKPSGAALKRVSVMTFAQCADGYIRAHHAGWSPKHAAQFSGSLKEYAFPVFGDLPVQAVDVSLIMKAIESLWMVRPETASRVRGRIEMILDWALARGYRKGENPARWRGHLQNLLPHKTKVRAVKHYAAMPYGEIAGFMAELRGREGIAPLALRFAILTATRTGETLGAYWDEIKIPDRVWVIPAERMKTKKEHRVPLSDAALEILRQVGAYRVNDLVFPSVRQNRSLSPVAFLRVLQAMGREGITGHGFRSTFADWAAERTNFPAEVREMALAHAVGNKVEAAYRRGDLFEKRRQLAEAWSSFCGADRLDGKVIDLVRHAAR